MGKSHRRRLLFPPTNLANLGRTRCAGTGWVAMGSSHPILTSLHLAWARLPLSSLGRLEQSTSWTDCLADQQDLLTNRNPSHVGSTAEIEHVSTSCPVAPRSGCRDTHPSHTHLNPYALSQCGTRPEDAARPALPRNTDHMRFQPSRGSSTACSRPRLDSDAVTTRLASEPVDRRVSFPSTAWPRWLGLVC